jgi:glutathione synthase/RimK-type ligase-like ATP-grasp enzyme
MKIIPYKLASASGKALAEALDIKRYLRNGVAIKGDDKIINWGSSSIDRPIQNHLIRILNNFENVQLASNKLETFKALHGHVSIPLYTTVANEALEWLGEGDAIVARHKLNGHSAEGLEIYENLEEFKPAPLYTKYVKKKHEYRVHVFDGKVIFQQRKARKLDVPDDQVDWQVRNHANGFIYAHEGVNLANKTLTDCIEAVRLLGLDFGAVDVIVTAKGVHYILEINTACGLEGATLDAYVQAFKEFQ